MYTAYGITLIFHRTNSHDTEQSGSNGQQLATLELGEY